MGRRVRHFNPADMGATMALDARFIQGIANGGSIENWNSRRPATFDFSQATSGQRPTMTTSTANHGGAQTVTTASASSQNMTNGAVLVPSTTAEWTLIAANITSAIYSFSQSSNTSMVGALVTNYNLRISRAQLSIISTAAIQYDNTMTSPAVSGVSCGRRSGSAQTQFTNRTTVAEQSQTTGSTANLRTGSNGNTVLTAYTQNIGAVCGILAATTLAQRNRIMHSYAFSFKLAQ